MRKRNVEHTFKTIFWWFIYLLPLILFLFAWIGHYRSEIMWQWWIDNDTDPTNIGFAPSLQYFMERFISYNNLYDIFYDLFYDGTYFSLRGEFGLGLILYISYFVTMVIFHLFVDFVLFIPRLAHKWMSGFTRTDE